MTQQEIDRAIVSVWCRKLSFIVLLEKETAIWTLGPYEHLFPFSMFEILMATWFDLFWQHIPCNERVSTLLQTQPSTSMRFPYVYKINNSTRIFRFSFPCFHPRWVIIGRQLCVAESISLIKWYWQPTVTGFCFLWKTHCVYADFIGKNNNKWPPPSLNSCLFLTEIVLEKSFCFCRKIDTTRLFSLNMKRHPAAGWLSLA